MHIYSHFEKIVVADFDFGHKKKLFGKNVSSGHKPALVPDKWTFFCKVATSNMGNDSRFPNSARHGKLVYIQMTNW